MSWLIYKHTNKLNGKCYIGQTCKSLKDRWGKDGYNYIVKKDGKYSQSKFARAILKVGWDNFSHEIIEKNISSQELANELEIYYINHFNSVKNGYNISAGGTGITMPSKPILQITKEENKIVILKEWSGIAEASRTLNISDRSIRNTAIGKRVSAGGFYWCYKRDFKNWIPKGEINYAKYTKWTKNQISFIKNEFNNYTIEELSKLLNKSIHSIHCKANKLGLLDSNNGKRKIYCFETNKSYNSIAAASRELNIPGNDIQRCCSRKRLTAKQYHFCYLENKEDFKIIEPKKSKKVICVELNRTYDSIKDAGNDLNILPENICVVCKNIALNKNKGQKTVKNYHFCYLNDLNKCLEIIKNTKDIKWTIKEDDFLKENYCKLGIKKCADSLGRSKDAVNTRANKLGLYIHKSLISKKVFCKELDRVFDSIREASNNLKIDRRAITKCCDKKQDVAGGYHWKYY